MPRNKAHKQKFSSKRALADKQQGRKVSAKASTATKRKNTSGTVNPHMDSVRRQQQAAALRNNKRNAILTQKRIGACGGPPRVIGLVPINEAANSLLAAREIVSGLPQRRVSADEAKTEDEAHDFSRPVTFACSATKQRFTLVTEAEGNEQDVLDAAKVADVMVLVLNVSSQVQETIKKLATLEEGGDDEEFDDAAGADEADWQDAVDEDRKSRVTATTWFGDIGLCITDQTRELMSLLNAQGSPSILVVLQGLETYENPRKRQKVLKLHERYFASVAAEGTKVLPLSTAEDVHTILRHCHTVKLRQLKWREQHPYLVIENFAYDDEMRKLQVSGYLRGANLSATQLLHLTNHGTFQIESIAMPIDPAALSKAHRGGLGEVDVSLPDERESLQKIQASDTVEDEGKPTESDVLQSRVAATRKVRVPAGVSEYQAAWYEHEGLIEGEDPALAAASRIQHDGRAGGEDDEEDDRFIDAELMSRNTTNDVDLMKMADVLRLERMTDEERLEELRRLKDQSEEEQWGPDMVDTPVNLPARQRFSKYRGMKSFHSSPWHTNENLPLQFGYVFKMVNYAKIRENSISKCNGGAVLTGHYITITLVDVPKSVVSCDGGKSLMIASAQLEHEQKWSVLHFHVQRNSELDEPLKSKTTLLLHVGFRKLYASPLYSDASTGDRTKFARFFQTSDKFRIASFYGPISYAPCPIVAFLAPSLEEQAERVPMQLAWFGSALPPNPDLLLLKKCTLSGRIAVINKKIVVIKYMFFNDDDVRWFMPVDIYTKLGRRGKILKPVGSKGLFKCTLNDQVMQHDTICMDLYKRVFPKWNTVEYNAAEVSDPVGDDDDANWEDAQ
jgi:pre-rRNA-processing protein TSR1